MVSKDVRYVLGVGADVAAAIAEGDQSEDRPLPLFGAARPTSGDLLRDSS